MKIILPAFVAFLVLVIAFYTFKVTPDAADKKAVKLLNDMGFSLAKAKTEKGFGTLTYKNIRLDEDGIDTVDEVKISYRQFPPNPRKLGKVRTIQITGLTLMGEITEEERIEFTGFKMPASLPRGQFQTLIFKDFKIGILTKLLHGITFEGDLQLRNTPDHTEIQGNVNSRQKDMRFSSTLSGTLTGGAYLDVTADIDQAAIALENIRISRATGKFSYEGDLHKDAIINGEFRAGGMSFYNLPFHDSSGNIQINRKYNQIRGVIYGTSLGQDPLSLTLAYKNQPEKIVYGYFEAPKVKNIINYYEAHKALLPENEALRHISATENIKVGYEYNHANQSIIYEVENEPELTGQLSLK